MQNSHIKLKEIIWEVCGRCENHCAYCGSKDTWDTKIDETNIIQIAQAIAKYPPEQIDMSGGDPLLVSYDIHKAITDVLKDKKVVCKILANPKSLCKKNNGSVEKILSLYTWVGISVNTLEELELIKNPGNFLINKSTVISNFNLENVFIYDQIETFVKKHKLIWQVQFTICKDKQLALYENEPALKHFFKKIQNSLQNGVNIVLADNINCGKCGAGLNSIGILYNGDIVPCLSMRSWVDDINKEVVGNLITPNIWSTMTTPLTSRYMDRYDVNPLKVIWEKCFDKYRFEEFKCCKDFCNNKYYDLNKIDKTIKTVSHSWDMFKETSEDEDKNKYKPIPDINQPQVMLYGCQTPDTVMVYGITYPQVTTYAVIGPPCRTWTSSSNTVIDCDKTNNKKKDDLK